MRINLGKCSLTADLDICISLSKILTICKDIFIQQKQKCENGNRTDDNGSLKLTFCILNSSKITTLRKIYKQVLQKLTGCIVR